MFKLTKEQNKKLNKWLNENNPDAYSGAIGGRITYMFTPTSLGLAVQAQDNLTKEILDLTDYEDW